MHADLHCPVCGSHVPLTGSLGQRVSLLRDIREMTAVELCRAASVSKTQLWRIEVDRSVPRPKIIAALAKALGVSVTELMAGL